MSDTFERNGRRYKRVTGPDGHTRDVEVGAPSGGMQGGSEDEMERKYGKGAKPPDQQGEKQGNLARAWGVYRKNNPAGGGSTAGAQADSMTDSAEDRRRKVLEAMKKRQQQQ